MLQFTLLCLLSLVPCALASALAGEGWENFTNNLATDLAPLITLFGDQVTKQYLSESINQLDNVIFALSPLGVLTAVVSVIRVCGSSSLRAFIGRAQEGRADAERELLPCVSESTAELFSDGGISRVPGPSRVVEIVAWKENNPTTGARSMEIGTLRQALLEGAWSCKGSGILYNDLNELRELDIPNLSLNKGIKRKSQFWFYCAAALGILLQIGVIIYAALTVFVYPTSFKKHGHIVPSYAFPFYLTGTTFLFIGMFFCAYIIERSSKEYYFHPTHPSKIYWLQPGRQQSGDQVFGAFLAVTEGPSEKMQYIKSTKRKYSRRYIGVYPTLLFTILGFVLQFVGLRGLHSSIIMAQMTSTIVMAVVRTCLKTERMAPDENILSKEERDLVTETQKELDYFAFHLNDVKSFKLLTAPTPPPAAFEKPGKNPSGSEKCTSSLSECCNLSVTSRLIRSRTRLAQLTSSAHQGFHVNWDDLPIRQIAHNLTHAIQETMNLVSSWTIKFEKNFEFRLLIECGSGPATDITPETYSISLSRSGDTLQWQMDETDLEVVLGLWTWSLTKATDGPRHAKLFRLVGLSEAEASEEETDLYFHKWIFRQTEAKMVPSQMIKSSRQFFGFESDKDDRDMHILVIQTDNELDIMAAQDIYIHFLKEALGYLTELGGEVDVVPGSQNSFLAHSSRIDELVHCFETCNMGSREDALLCIVPALKYHGLLPELAADSTNVRKRTEEYIKHGNWKSAFQLVGWICERSADAEFERSVYEMGYLCRRAMLESNEDAQREGFRQTCNLISSDIRLGFFQNRYVSRPPNWMKHAEYVDWWNTFSAQLGWIVWHISVNVRRASWMRPILASLNVTGTLPPAHEGEVTNDTENGLCALQQWLTCTDSDTSFERDVPGDEDQSGLEWTIRNKHYALLYFILETWVETGKFIPLLIRLGYMVAALDGCNLAVQVLNRHAAYSELLDEEKHTALLQLVINGDVRAVETLLANQVNANGNGRVGESKPLAIAARTGHHLIVKSLLHYGADVESRDDAGYTALHLAAFEGQLDIVRLLLSHGADVDPIGPGYRTPLLSVVPDGQIDMVELLLEHGATVNSKDNDGMTPVMLAARFAPVQVLQKLLQNGPDIRARNHYGLTALELAEEYDCPQAAALLREVSHV